MKLLFGLIIIVAVGFSINKYVFSTKIYHGATNITDVVPDYPVNLLDFKHIVRDYVYHLCYKNADTLAYHHVSIDECLSNYEVKKLECDEKVFRLAPLNLVSQTEILDYSRQYTKCILPYKYI